MQDNRYEEWDEGFVDRGWAEMHKLLEREMPVGRPKRGLIFFRRLLPAILLFLLAGGVQWSFTPPVTGCFPIKMTAENPTAAEAPAGLMNEKTRKEKRAPSTLDVSTTTSSRARVDADLLPLARLPVALPESDGVVSQSTQDPVAGMGDVPEQAAEIFARRGSHPLSPLSTLRMNVRRLPSPNAFDFQRATRSPAFSAFALVGATGPGFGFSAGVGIVRNTPNSRWYWGSGLEYQRYAQLLEAPPNSGADISQNNQMPNPGPEAVNITFPDPRLRVQRLVVPIYIGYQMHARWSMEINLGLGYLLQGHITNRDAFSTAEEQFGMGQTPSTIRAVQDGALSGDLLRSWDSWLGLDLEYRLSDRWRLRAGYQYGFSDFVDSDDWEAHHRFFRLGLMRRLDW